MASRSKAFNQTLCPRSHKKIINTNFKYKTRKCSQINLITVCLYPLSIHKAAERLFIFRRKKGSSPSLLGNRGLTWGVMLTDPRPCVQNTPQIQQRSPAVNTSLRHLLLKTGSPPFLLLNLWPRKSEHYSQEPRCTHGLQLHHASHSETTHIFTIAITWYILLIILIIADLDLSEARRYNARTIQHKHAADWGLAMRVNVRYTMFWSS